MSMTRSEQIRLESMRHYGFGTEAMKQIKICTHCRTPHDTKDEFCRECGNPLPKTTFCDTYKSRHKSFSRCGIVVQDNIDYCPQCGMRLEP